MTEEISLQKLEREIQWNAIEAESDVIIRVRPSHIVVLKDRLGSSESKLIEFKGSTFICYRLRQDMAHSERDAVPYQD